MAVDSTHYTGITVYLFKMNKLFKFTVYLKWVIIAAAKKNI